MKEIPLTRGKVAIVDDEDYEELSIVKWHYNHWGYAMRNVTPGGKKRTKIQMHIAILGKIEGFEIDHKDGNGLNNRRENLRHVTHTQNTQNKAPYKKTSSRYKGVSWNKWANKWVSTIVIDGKYYYLGYYKSERDAAWVYNVWAESFFGEYTRLNVLEASNGK